MHECYASSPFELCTMFNWQVKSLIFPMGCRWLLYDYDPRDKKAAATGNHKPVYGPEHSSACVWYPTLDFVPTCLDDR